MVGFGYGCWAVAVVVLIVFKSILDSSPSAGMGIIAPAAIAFATSGGLFLIGSLLILSDASAKRSWWRATPVPLAWGLVAWTIYRLGR